MFFLVGANFSADYATDYMYFMHMGHDFIFKVFFVVHLCVMT